MFQLAEELWFTGGGQHLPFGASPQVPFFAQGAEQLCEKIPAILTIQVFIAYTACATSKLCQCEADSYLQWDRMFGQSWAGHVESIKSRWVFIVNSISCMAPFLVTMSLESLAFVCLHIVEYKVHSRIEFITVLGTVWLYPLPYLEHSMYVVKWLLHESGNGVGLRDCLSIRIVREANIPYYLQVKIFGANVLTMRIPWDIWTHCASKSMDTMLTEYGLTYRWIQW